jgi:hypothetical protein
MVALYLQNPKKMVRIIITTIFAHLFFVCMGQEKHLDNKIELNASFSSDSVLMDDSLELNLYYRNNSGNSFSLYPKAFIGLLQNPKIFITYDKLERMVYKLNDICDYDSVIVLKPNESFEYRYRIKADSNFFYTGVNDISIIYTFNDKPLKKDKKKADKSKVIRSLVSPSIKIRVYSNGEK